VVNASVLRRAACFGASGLLLLSQLTEGHRWPAIVAGVVTAAPALAVAWIDQRRGASITSDVCLGVGVLMTVPVAAGLLNGPAGWALGFAGLAAVFYGFRSAEQ
jgi:hypothetical protein